MSRHRTGDRLQKTASDVGDALWSPNEDLEPARWSGVPLYLGVAASIALLLVLRRTDGVTNPQFWAEDGTVFFQENLKLGCWRALHTLFRGFPYLGQRLVACAATPCPIIDVPLVYNGVAYIVSAASLASFSLPSFRHIVRSDALRVVFCFAVAALPQATELVGNLTNMSWYLGFCLMLMTIMRLPRSPVVLVGLSSACLLAVFSTPLSILTGPLWFARGLHALATRRWRELGFATVAACGLLALICLAGDLGRDPGAPPSLAASLLNSVSMLVLAHAALGPPAVLSLVGSFGPSTVYGIALALLVTLAMLAYLGGPRGLPVLLYCGYGVVGSSALVLIGHRNLAVVESNLDSLIAWLKYPGRWPLFSGRYHLLAVGLVQLAFLAMLDRFPRGRARSIATVGVMTWLLCTEAMTFVITPLFDLDWSANAARLEAKLADRTPEPLLIPVNPDRLAFRFNISLDSRSIAPEVSVPSSAILGPLLSTTRFEQSFVARCPDVSEIDLFFGKEGHPTGTVEVQLSEDQAGPVSTTLVVDAATVASDIDSILRLAEQKVSAGEVHMTPDLEAFLSSPRLARALYFAPIRHSEGKRYVIAVTASGGAPGDALTLYGSDADAYPDGEARRNGELIRGDLAFRYGCTRP